MADTNETFNRNLYDLLRTKGFNPVPKDSSNNRTDPETADVFKFTFKKDGTEYGDAWVTLDDGQVTLYSSNELEDSPDARTQGVDYDDTWTGFQKHLRYWALTNQPRHAKGYQKFNRDRLGDDMARREYMKKKERLEEGYYPMGKQASYSDTIPTVKIILQHTRQIQEGEQRYRNVSKIFLENTLGERILAPTIRPGIAQVYARHIAEGGVPNDERWNHIKSLCEEYGKMAGFVRATKNHQFNESAQELVNTGVDHYVKLRETLGKMRGHRGYTTYFESWTPTLMEDNGDDNTINELFVQETLDPRIESVLPILSKLRKKNVSEMKEVDELAEWADSLTEAPGDETLAHNKKTEDDRLKALDLAEDDDAVKAGQVARDKIRKPAFMRKAAGEKPATLGDVERSQQHRSSQAMVGQKGQEVEESGLQAYLGNKKYGKDGMDALRKAGRDGASKEKMANIRAKYDKLDEEGMEEGWNDRLDDPDNYEEYLDRLRDLADYNRKRDIEDPPQKHKAPTDDSKKKADESVDDMFSLSGKLPPTDRIDNVSGQDMSFDDKMRASTIKHLLKNNPNLKIDELPTNTADLIKMLDQHPKKNVSEMDNRTPAGDRREQRANSPEAIAQREKELQADLKKVSPEMRKKLRLPEPKEGVAEGKEDLHAQLQAINQKLKLMKGGPVGEPNSLAFVGKRKALLKQKEQILSQLKQGVAEGSGPKEKQKTPYRDINSPEYRKAAEKQKQQMAKDAAAELGKKLADKIAKKGVAEGWGFDQWGHDTWTDAQKEVARKKKYEMMLSNGKVKRFTAKDDADAKRIAKGHGAKSVIKMKGDLPGNKIAEQSVAEGERKLGPAPGQSTPNQAERAKSRDHQRTDAAKKARDASQRKGLKQDKDGTYYAKEGVAEGRYTPPKNTYYITQTSINSDEGRSVDVFDLMYNGKIIKRYNLLASADRQLRRLRAAGNQVQMDEQGVAEDLDANQKRVGQLGPTEKVKNNNIGKLVGANESVNLSEMDSEGHKGHRGDEDSGKGPEKSVKPVKAKDADKDAEKVLDKAMDKAHKKDVKEGQEDLDAILRIIRR